MGLFAALVIVAIWFVPVDEGRLRQVPLSIPLSFEANQGQTDPSVRFLSRGRGSTLFLTPTEAVLTLRSAARASRAASIASMATEDPNATTRRTDSIDAKDATDATTQQTQSVVLRMRLVN